MSAASDILKLIKEKEIEFVDLRFKNSITKTTV